MFDAFPFGREACWAIESVHGAVEGLVRPAKIGRHQIGIVEVGQGGVRMGSAGVEHGLRYRLQFRPVRTPGRRRKGIVDEADGIAVTAFQPPTDMAQPGHVHGGGEQRKISEGGVLKHKNEIAGDRRWSHPPGRHIFPPLRTHLGNDQKRRGGKNVHMIERRRFRQFLRGFAFAGFTVSANSSDTLLYFRQARQSGGRRIMQGKNPALAAL